CPTRTARARTTAPTPTKRPKPRLPLRAVRSCARSTSRPGSSTATPRSVDQFLLRLPGVARGGVPAVHAVAGPQPAVGGTAVRVRVPPVRAERGVPQHLLAFRLPD